MIPEDEACFLPVEGSRAHFYIVKVAGGNWSDDKDFFVATNRGYNNLVEAENVARDLAMKTPGNRYYVVQEVVGYMSHVPRLERVNMTVGRYD